MFKFIFDLATEPLGLLIEWYYEWIILLVSGMIEAWGRGFEKIREACALYDGPLPEYEINEAGIIVFCKFRINMV